MKKLLIALLVVLSSTLQAQSTIELLGTPSNGGPSGNGPSTSSKYVTMYKNATTAYTPTIDATFSLSNQQFSTIEGNSGWPGVTFGAEGDATNFLAGSPYYPQLNAYGGNGTANNAFFTACKTCAVGTGIDINENYGLQLYPSTDALINSTGSSTLALNGRAQYADLTITFSSPVNNPVLHLKGLGGAFSYNTPLSPIDANTVFYNLGYTVEFLLLSGQTFTKLSGSTYLDVSNTFITTNATNMGPIALGAFKNGLMRYGASGSILVNGTNISTIQLRMYLRGDGGKITDWNGNTISGNNGNAPLWSIPGNFHPAGYSGDTWNGNFGDAFLMSVSFENPITLPVKLISFEAKKIANCATQLNWKTATEINSSHFKIQQSSNGINFNTVGTVKSVNSSTGSEYQFAANATNETTNYYRLMMVDNNATQTFSNVVSVSGCKNVDINIYPNPTSNQLNITGINIGDVIQITNDLGQVVLFRTALQIKETISTGNWAKAIYNIIITDKLTGQKLTKKITKQ